METATNKPDTTQVTAATWQDLNITKEHAQLLADAAITPQAAKAAGIYSIKTTEELPPEFADYGTEAVPALLFPIWKPPDSDKEPVPQLRPDKPLRSGAKYVFPTGQGPGIGELRAPDGKGRPVLIVEGTKQALAAASWAPDDYGVYALAGCNGASKVDVGFAEGHPVCLFFDADWKTNPHVWDGADRLHHALTVAGAKTIAFCRVPVGGKEGLDDYLGRVPGDQRRRRILRMIDKAEDGLGRRPASRRATGLSREEAEGRPVLPPPHEPLKVAEALLIPYLHEGLLTLHAWRGSWMKWDTACWKEFPDDEMRAAFYRATGDAVCTGEKGSVYAWAPNRRTVGDLSEAFAALVHLPQSVEMPCFLTPPPPEGGPGSGPGPVQAKTINSKAVTCEGSKRSTRSTQNNKELLMGKRLVISCTNGLLDVATRTLTPHTPAFFNTVAVPYPYTPGATCPAWETFLRELWPDEPDNIRLLQEWFGYVVSGLTSHHKILLLVGPPRSGKGTAAIVLIKLMGGTGLEDDDTPVTGTTAVAAPSMEDFSAHFGLEQLIGKPLAVIPDARLSRKGARSAVEKLLSVSAKDTVTVHRKHRTDWIGRLPTRIVMLSNELPAFEDSSGAIAGRFLVLQTHQSFFGREDPTLAKKLEKELPGILNWALNGLDRLMQNGRFTVPAGSKEAVTAMQEIASPVTVFINECCTVCPDCQTPCDELWQEWTTWAQDHGVPTGTREVFGRDLRAAVPRVRKSRPREDGKRLWTYSGIAFAHSHKNEFGPPIADRVDQVDNPQVRAGAVDDERLDQNLDRAWTTAATVMSGPEPDLFYADEPPFPDDGLPALVLPPSPTPDTRPQDGTVHGIPLAHDPGGIPWDTADLCDWTTEHLPASPPGTCPRCGGRLQPLPPAMLLRSCPACFPSDYPQKGEAA
ncbi:hypothetical protein I5Q34_00490 [Streptomyces sp. AV19]|uniref:DNA primase family protein n=1 Tax=Streptomyces sp. AV19 TaxID=2793068 RepID=UPI0018FEC058|nr:phage/plasmid primase, P4 family [Streptomyces sp. AV19]MBH1932786.1 hypothetical protein [Streptomyces sp. AV19]MDG4531457.1 phage/plasmid primase, P4 family [Streptomyces sp. AV19]